MMGSWIAARHGRKVCRIVEPFAVSFGDFSIAKSVKSHLVEVSAKSSTSAYTQSF